MKELTMNPLPAFEDQTFDFCCNQTAEPDLEEYLNFQRDFIRCCMDRKVNDIGSCNLPYQSLSEEKELLNRAYEIYCNVSNTGASYAEKLNLVVTEVEREIRIGRITLSPMPVPQKVVIVLEEGMVNCIYSTHPGITVEVADMEYAAANQMDTFLQHLDEKEQLVSIPYHSILLGHEEQCTE